MTEQRKRICIVGGVAGGASTAARLRRLDEHAEIIIFERDEHISFANCGLPYYIGETIMQREKLLVVTPQLMKNRFNLDVRVFSEVIGVDFANKTMTVRNTNTSSYELAYDALVLSPGAKPLRPPIPGIESSRIMTLRNLADMDRIKQVIDQSDAQQVVVVGGGYIGIEMAENVAHRGLKVTVVEAAPHILAPFDTDMVVFAEQELQANGVELVLGDSVTAFEENFVTLKSGRQVFADLVILAIGVQPDTAFLQDSGLELGPRGHILVNQHMQTNQNGVYALGDAVEVVHYINQQKTAIPLAGPANKQGRIVADHICGLDSKYKGTQGTAIIKVFELTAASTGFNERALQASGVKYHVVHVHPNSHAGYYPGASQLSLKLIFGENGEIYGAQAMGKEGVDKRIDVIATVIRMGGTVDDLTELELCYAPPFSSAKDPVNLAGFAAQNILVGLVAVVMPETLLQQLPEGVLLVDVRSAAEHSRGAIPHSLNIPVDELRDRLDELHAVDEVWVYCQVGFRGYVASRILQQYGFQRVKNISGGYKSYSMLTNH